MKLRAECGQAVRENQNQPLRTPPTNQRRRKADVHRVVHRLGTRPRRYGVELLEKEGN
jgi:hypothetical protein